MINGPLHFVRDYVVFQNQNPLLFYGWWEYMCERGEIYLFIYWLMYFLRIPLLMVQWLSFLDEFWVNNNFLSHKHRIWDSTKFKRCCIEAYNWYQTQISEILNTAHIFCHVLMICIMFCGDISALSLRYFFSPLFSPFSSAWSQWCKNPLDLVWEHGFSDSPVLCVDIVICTCWKVCWE